VLRADRGWVPAVTDTERAPSTSDAAVFLVCSLASRLCALPLGAVLETMRPLPLVPFSGAPDFVLGLAVIRGEAVPVVDAGRLAGDRPVRAGRFVTLRAGGRTAALAVEGVMGLKTMGAASFAAFPPLLAGDDSGVVRAVAARDPGLLVVLDGVRLLPEDTWKQLDAAGAAP